MCFFVETSTEDVKTVGSCGTTTVLWCMLSLSRLLSKHDGAVQEYFGMRLVIGCMLAGRRRIILKSDLDLYTSWNAMMAEVFTKSTCACMMVWSSC
jgi:hypothetical protein